MLVELTMEHMNAGKRNHCDCCPLALALNDATREQWVVSRAHYWRARDPQVMFPLPDDARAWVSAWDDGRACLSTCFELEVV